MLRCAMLTSGIFALSFTVLSDAIVPAMRGRIMCFAYVPLLFAEILGPTLGALITQRSLFAIFPTAALLTALGVSAVAWAFLDDLWTIYAPCLGGVWTFAGYPRNKQ